MKSSPVSGLAGLCVFAIASFSAHGQFYKLHSAEVAVGGTGQFTTSVTSQDNLPHQATTNSTGFLFSFHDAPVAGRGSNSTTNTAALQNVRKHVQRSNRQRADQLS